MNTRQQKRITVYEGDPTDDLPDTLDAVISWFQTCRDTIPIEYQESTCCELSSWDGHKVELSIYYMRDETPAEAAERELEEQRSADARKNAELIRLRALLAKYPDEDSRLEF